MEKIISKEEFKDHVLSISPISEGQFEKLLEEINNYYDIGVKEYIQTRHLELKKLGMKNEEIYRTLLDEIGQRRFASPELSLRQVRRIIYG